MNDYINAQCQMMIAQVSTFEHACELAAKKDDGIISKEEEKALKKIKKIATKFKLELGRI